MLLKNTSNKFAALILTLLIAATGCKRDSIVTDNPPVVEPPTVANDAVKVVATISGSVVDENKQPVANAVVTSDTYSGSTDAMGNFTFKNINISAANGHVTVIKAGYFKGIRSFVTAAGKNNFVKIQLIKQVLSGTIASTAGGTVNANGATISFPANAFVTTTGAAYNGSVKVFAAWIDPTAANLPLIIPGDLRGLNSSNGEYILKSYGMVGAELQDASGNILKLAPGKTASISFPIPAALLADAPATVPLWHFDEVSARWKEEGTATKNGSTYTASVDKFSFWNVDIPANFINLDARFVNSTNNLPLANTMIKITSISTNTAAYGYTNDSGYVSGYVPKNQSLKLEVIANVFCSSGTAVYTQNIGPYTANVSLGTINITLPATQVISFTGTVKNCGNQVVTNGYVSLNLSNGVSAIAYTNASGQVNFSSLYCGGSIGYSYNAVDLTTGSASNTSTGTATSNTVALGTITACGTTVNVSGVYIAGGIGNDAVLWKDGVATRLTSNSSTGSKYAYAVKTIVYNNDVYVLGDEEDTTSGSVSIIKLWKNGVLTNITNGTTEAYGLGLDIYNGDVYIVGTERLGNTTSGMVWKNGVATVLAKDTFKDVEPSDVKIINGDVYISGKGSQSLTSKAIYWKNGTLNHLSASNILYGEATGVFSYNGDIYFSGSETTNSQGNVPGVYWKNGVKTIVTIPSPYTIANANTIFVENNDGYIGGSTYFSGGGGTSPYSNAGYWKNNSCTLLTNFTVAGTDTDVYGILVKNNIVYIVGEHYLPLVGSTPVYFQNNIAVPLTGYAAGEDAYCYAVFVQ